MGERWTYSEPGLVPGDDHYDPEKPVEKAIQSRLATMDATDEIVGTEGRSGFSPRIKPHSLLWYKVKSLLKQRT